MPKILKFDERGSLSIESCIIYPIVMFILIIFLQLLRIMIVTEKIENYVQLGMIEYQTLGYEKYSEADFRKLISEKLSPLNNKTLIKNLKLDCNINSEYIASIQVTFSIELFWNEFNYNLKNKISLLNKGKYLSDYGLVSQKIYCNDDIWKYSNIKRGNYIAYLLNKNLNANESKIDSIDKMTLSSIVSVDLRTKTYNEKLDLLKNLKDEIRKIKDFREGTLGNYEITKEMYDKKQLIIAIPDMEITEYYKNELTYVKKYCAKNDIQCKFIMIGKEKKYE